ncbi:uncharacterized protein LTR77_009441 [Saxophila tyrrhenica]|uniref:Uncharacterized protein n=1 Tax=Saxophila tyrrhenica TaxID=1690608 RepID=A0AAV9NY82_9PEZI|nr:hypothetical protein LTR77_009441 [Saxophila tyrrhenica]
MPSDHPSTPEKDHPGYDYEADKQWSNKPLTPAQVLVNDIRLEKWRPDHGPLLEIHERSASTKVPVHASATPSASYVRAADAAGNPIEQQKFAQLEEHYGWIRRLRLHQHQRHVYDSEESAKCRWIHCSSKFPEYVGGFLWALSEDLTTISSNLQVLNNTLQQQTRFSKHGKCFAPFSQPLQPGNGKDAPSTYPMLLSVPFLDWSILGEKPPLRFQIDKREGFQSARTASHLLRSVLQHFFRLEDTADREAFQVFAKHKPWSTNRELDLKVRQWYGHYPSALNVDELWVLVIDPEHIVTFSSNQTWKSRWPPLQLVSRISDVSFRNIRNAFFSSEEKQEYTSLTHAVACLSGAVGMLHRNFWPDMVLPCTDRYAGYLGHLQYRLHRAASTKLVMDLIACQEELNIVIQITQQQIDMINNFRDMLDENKEDSGSTAPSPTSVRPSSGNNYNPYGNLSEPPGLHHRVTYNARTNFRHLSTSSTTDPLAQVLDNLARELTDLQDLRDNTDRLVTRTIQLVNIRLEDHGKAILVFTVVTIVFLPLNFVSSFFGMNFSDIRDMAQTQWLFWAVAICVTTAVVAASVFLAFSGGRILENILMWRDQRRERRLTTKTAQKQAARELGEKGFRVNGVERSGGFSQP